MKSIVISTTQLAQTSGVDDCVEDESTFSQSNNYVIEKSPRKSSFGSKDPLFGGTYFHTGSMTTEAVEKYNSTYCGGDSNTNKKKNKNSVRVYPECPNRN